MTNFLKNIFHTQVLSRNYSTEQKPIEKINIRRGARLSSLFQVTHGDTTLKQYRKNIPV